MIKVADIKSWQGNWHKNMALIPYVNRWQKYLRGVADTLITEKEGPDMGSWSENLPNRSRIEEGVADSSKWLIQ